MITRETRRQARRPLAGHLQLETMTLAYEEVARRADDLPVSSATERNYAEGYAQALRDFARETGERQEALRRAQLKSGGPRRIPGTFHKIVPLDHDDGSTTCEPCGRPLSLVAIRTNELAGGLGPDGPDVREVERGFWAHAS